MIACFGLFSPAPVLQNITHLVRILTLPPTWIGASSEYSIPQCFRDSRDSKNDSIWGGRREATFFTYWRARKNRHHIVDEPRGSGTSQINQQQPPTNWTPSRSSSHYHMPRSFFQTARGNVHTPGIRQQAYTMPQKPLTICQRVATLPVSIRGVKTFPLWRRKASA